MSEGSTIHKHVLCCVGCIRAVGTCRVMVWVEFVPVVVEEGVMATAESGEMDAVLSCQSGLRGVDSRWGEV